MKLIVTIFVVYLLLAAAIVVGLIRVRNRTLAESVDKKAQAVWDEWRAAAAMQTGEKGPVQRAQPTSTEPPLLVLMRDHFGAAIFGLLAPATALYLFFAWIVTGVVKQSRTPPRPSGDPKHLTEP